MMRMSGFSSQSSVHLPSSAHHGLAAATAALRRCRRESQRPARHLQLERPRATSSRAKSYAFPEFPANSFRRREDRSPKGLPDLFRLSAECSPKMPKYFEGWIRSKPGVKRAWPCPPLRLVSEKGSSLSEGPHPPRSAELDKATASPRLDAEHQRTGKAIPWRQGVRQWPSGELQEGARYPDMVPVRPDTFLTQNPVKPSLTQF